MPINNTSTALFAGIDDLSFDIRNFKPSQKDIERLCHFFCLGKLLHFEKEKGITVSHSNFFIFVATTKGQYALKFYSKELAKPISIEYAINRLLVHHHFPTPLMHASHDGKPFTLSNDRLATCYSYINGKQAWEKIKERGTIHQINGTLLSLKNILSSVQERIAFGKQENLTTTIHTLAKNSDAMMTYDQKSLIEASLLKVSRTYKDHQVLFTRQYIHNNASLTNFLICKKTAYLLDLSHIQEDYLLSDMASLVISCLFLDVSSKKISALVKNHFTLHKINLKFLVVLNTLIKIGLIKEYLKNTHREKSVRRSSYSSRLTDSYTYYLSKRQKLITMLLDKVPL